MRTPKKPLSAWIVTNREAQPTEDGKGWTSGELARRLGVSDSTVRGWEAGRSVSEGNLELMERLFGVTAPGHEEPSDLAAMLQAQNAYLSRITVALEKLAGITPPDEEGFDPLHLLRERAAEDPGPARRTRRSRRGQEATA